MEEQEKAEKAAQPPLAKKRLKRGRGRNAKKRKGKGGDGEDGYEVVIVLFVFLDFSYGTIFKFTSSRSRLLQGVSLPHLNYGLIYPQE